VKRWICSIFSLALIVTLPLSAFADQSAFKIGNGKYSINGTIKEDAEPYIKNGRTYLPLRYAAYSVGIGDNSIYWSTNSQTAYLAKNGTILSVKIGTHSIQVGSRAVPVDAPAEMYKDRVMLPIRAIAEGFGCNVQWDAKDYTVIVNTKE
jgi:hypothetical protein